jgi:ABC-2 type transport system permease protein
MNTMLATGTRIAGERQTGWNRQLRITPLSPRTYFRAKLLTSYALALVTLVVLYASGATLGVRLDLGTWIEMTALVLVGLVPFAALGILFGHLLTTDSIGPVIGGSTALLALLGGAWFPITGGVLHAVAETLPSYWLVQASRIGIGGQAWGATGWIVIAAWTIVTTALATRAYRRDTKQD